MSGHSEDPIAEESKRFFTFFNLSMLLVAITGIEIVIIYVQTFDGASIIGVLFATSIVKFVGVVTWFMHLKWDKILNTILFLMGLVIAVFTFFAVIYMSDDPPEVIEFNVASVENDWSADAGYSSGDYVKIDDSYFLCLSDHSSPSPSPTEKSSSPTWEKVNGVPHEFNWKVSTGDLIEINSLKPENPFFHHYNPVVSVENDWSAETDYSSGDYVKIDDSYFLCLSDHSSPSPSPTEKSSSPTWEKVNGVPNDNDNIEGSLISVLEKKASTEDFRIKVRSEAFWVENN
jgi:cytochrome c oxidase subunit 4